MLVGMILTVGIGLFVYLWNPFNQRQNHKRRSADGAAKGARQTKTNNYEFYDLLKEQQVSAVPDEAAASQPVSAQPDVVLTQADSTSAPKSANVSVVDNPCCLMITEPNHALQPTIAR